MGLGLYKLLGFKPASKHETKATRYPLTVVR